MVEKGRRVPSDQDNRASRSEIEISELRASLSAEKKRHHEELRQFSYAVSHDLREPMRMIVSYAQLLDRRYEGRLDEDGADFMRFILDAAQRMDRLLGDLLIYSHQFRSLDQALDAVEPQAALESAVLALDAAIKETGAHVSSDPLPPVHFDLAQLTQLFQQLIANSVRFRGPEPPRIHVSAIAIGDAIQFSVRDNGIGIDPRYHQQIFGLFKRLHGREYPGTGIGLAIAKRIVEQTGGRIWVVSQPGQGSTFHFTVSK